HLRHPFRLQQLLVGRQYRKDHFHPLELAPYLVESRADKIALLQTDQRLLVEQFLVVFIEEIEQQRYERNDNEIGGPSHAIGDIGADRVRVDEVEFKIRFHDRQ